MLSEGDSVHATVLEVLRKVAGERNIAEDLIEPRRNLVDIGFRSLDLSRVIALLELRLGVDPFDRLPITDIRTVGELCTAYALGVQGEVPPSDPEPPPRRRRLDDGEAADRRREARQAPWET